MAIVGLLVVAAVSVAGAASLNLIAATSPAVRVSGRVLPQPDGQSVAIDWEGTSAEVVIQGATVIGFTVVDATGAGGRFAV
jgi:hypothetical protein